jgi:hypothetical protein
MPWVNSPFAGFWLLTVCLKKRDKSRAPITATTATTLKFSFENQTAGTNLDLCAGTAADFAAGTCSVRLSDSGGPGFVFLTITDTSQLSGKIIFVQRVVGIATAEFTLTVE